MPESPAVIQGSLGRMPARETELALEHSWTRGTSASWSGLIAREHNGCGLPLWDACLPAGEPPLVVASARRQDSPVLRVPGWTAGLPEDLWADRARDPLGRYEISARDPQEYWVYRPLNRTEFRYMCQSCAGSIPVLFLALDGATPVGDIRRLLEALATTTSEGRYGLAGPLAAFRRVDWLYAVGLTHPARCSLFLPARTELTRVLLDCHKRTGTDHIVL
jgi:hypothetical protein